MQGIYWLDEPATYEIRDGVARCTFTSGGEAIEFRSTVATLVGGTANANVAIDDHERRNSAACVRFRERSAEH